MRLPILNYFLVRTIFPVILFTGFLNCKKHPDDPFISLRIPYHRLKGEWTRTKIFLDGADSTAWQQANPQFMVNYDFDIKEMVIHYKQNGKSIDVAPSLCDFAFSEDENKLMFYPDLMIRADIKNYFSAVPERYSYSCNDGFDIIKLTHEEMHVSSKVTKISDKSIHTIDIFFKHL